MENVLDNYSAYNNADNFNEYNVSQKEQNTFLAYVDGVIPRTPGLAEEYGRIQFFGALDSYTNEYLIYTLNYYDVPLAKAVARLLDLAGERFLEAERYNNINYPLYPSESTFAALADVNRFRALSYLEQISEHVAGLPEELVENPGVVRTINSTLSRYTVLGYYSEWPGYGSTRLNPPDERRLEFYPLSWQQVDYPGPSMGYRALRE
jgi:hypothetical protein